jgi:hypothetical protein
MVHAGIGRGSPNTVSPYLDTWFKGLGGRIKDPAAFAAPPELPDPVQQAAKHFWEVALAETRRDFDKRLQDGLAEAVANVGAEKENAEQANAPPTRRWQRRPACRLNCTSIARHSTNTSKILQPTAPGWMKFAPPWRTQTSTFVGKASS